MKAFICLFLVPVLIFTRIGNSNAQDYISFIHVSGSGNESVDALDLDEKHQIYIAGSFDQNLIIRGHEIYRSVGETDIYLAQFKEDGNLNWIRTGGGLFSEQSIDLITDEEENVYWTGSYTLEVQFDSVSLKVDRGASGLFLSKYNRSGELKWLRNIIGTGVKDIAAIEYKDGLLYLAGSYSDSLFLFDTTLIANGRRDLFVASINTQGEKIWLNSFGEKGDFYPTDLTTDHAQNLLLTGFFQGAVFFSQDSLVSNTPDPDAFLIKIRKNGDPEWSRKLGGVHDDRAQTVSVDGEGNAYVGGSFLGVLKYSFDQSIQTDGFNFNFFILKFSPEGEALWAQSLGNQQSDESVESLYFSNDTLWAVGTFEQDLNIPPLSLRGGPGAISGFVAAFSPEGIITEAGAFATSDILLLNQIVGNAGGRRYLSGNFSRTADLGSEILTSNGPYDGFVVHSNLFSTVVQSVNSTKSELAVYPNPTESFINLQSPFNNYQAQIFSQHGQLMWKGENTTTVDVSSWARGVYYLQLESHKGLMLHQVFIVN